MGALSSTVFRVVSLGLLTSLIACGGDDGESSDTTERDDSTTTTEESDESQDGAGGTGYLVDGTLEVFGFESELTAVVADPETYHLQFSEPGAFDEQIRVGEQTWFRFGSDESSIDSTQWTELPAEEGTTVGGLTEFSLTPGGAEEIQGLGGADLAGDALVEVLITAPHLLVDVEEVGPGETDLEPEIPEDIANALDRLDVDEPELQLEVVVEDKVLVSASLEIDSPGTSYELDVTYSDHGEVTAEDVVEPTASEIDATPWLHEEALAAVADIELLAPASPPAGLVLVGAQVVPAALTLEGCEQVQLDYDVPPGEPVGDRFLTLFLLPKPCAVGFDPTEFDQILGGHPSRFDGYEVLVGGTVVQLGASETLAAEIDAVAASLTPVALDALLAAVVAPE